MPPKLAAFRLTRAQALPVAHQNTLMAELSDIPRPPRSLQKLVSTEFLSKASSSELSDLVLDEPLVSAKVLATVNAPFYGLRSPVSSIGQAMTYLGLNSMRGICVKYMVEAAFQPSSAELKRIYDDIWCASAFACELCVKIAQKLQWSDQGTLVTQVALSFIGRLAAASLLPEATARRIAALSLLDRAIEEQKGLGLSASEIGGLLMKEWALPESLVQDVLAMDRVLTQPASVPCSPAQTRLALCYLCARLGERLATGQLTDLVAFDPCLDTDADLHHFASYWPGDAMNSLTALMQAPDLQKSVLDMRAGLQT